MAIAKLVSSCLTGKIFFFVLSDIFLPLLRNGLHVPKSGCSEPLLLASSLVFSVAMYSIQTHFHVLHGCLNQQSEGPQPQHVMVK